MRAAFAIAMVAAGLHSAAGQAPAQNAELDRLVKWLAPKLAGIGADLDTASAVARRDSGSARADSAVVRFRRKARQAIIALGQTPVDTAFDITMNKDGAISQMRARRGAASQPLATNARDSLIAFMRSRGVRISNEEGSLYFELSVQALLDRTGTFLTPAFREYLSMELEEETQRSAEDGSLMVPVDVIVDRIARTERFIATYPNAIGARFVAYNRDRYVAWILYMGESMGPFDLGTGEVKPGHRRAMERLASEQAAHPSGKAARELLDLLKANGFRRTPAIDAFSRSKGMALHDDSPRGAPPA